MPGSVRIGAAWLFALVFAALARPTAGLLFASGCVAAVGLVIRAWAAGTIDKDAELATGGPYAHTRNPLYLGSFIIGTGLSLAGGHWVWPVVFGVFFLVVYVPTMRREAVELADRFGARYREYASAVPAFAVRLTPYRPRFGGPDAGATPSPSAGARFSWQRYLRHREWEAALGVLGALGALALKLRIIG